MITGVTGSRPRNGRINLDDFNILTHSPIGGVVGAAREPPIQITPTLNPAQMKRHTRAACGSSP